MHNGEQHYKTEIASIQRRQAVNPYLPEWEYIPDGEPHIFGDRVYIYGSHDEAGGREYCTGDYVCWSAPATDLASWSFEGVIFRREDDPTVSERPLHLFAPDVAQGPDGRYYLYYFLTDFNKIGVAVCDTPAGHYHYYGAIRFESGEQLSRQSGYGMLFDPAILSDETGNWLYYGFVRQDQKEGVSEEAYKGGFVARLKNDMLTIVGTPILTIPGKYMATGTSFEGHSFLEASSIRHYGELYYLVYSSEAGHELCYAVSKCPYQGFEYKGVIVSNGDVGLNGRSEAEAVNYLGNNHGGLLRLNDDKVYIFYHRHTHGRQFSRQGCAEKVEIGENGEIGQAEITSCGLNEGPLVAKGQYSSHIACYLRSAEGVQHYSSSVHWNEAHPYIAQEKGINGVATLQNQFIYNLRDGAVCGFKYFLFDGTEQLISLRLRGTFDGTVLIHKDSSNGPIIAKIHFQGSKEWKWYETVIKPLNGVYAVFFEVEGRGSCDFDAFEIKS